MSHLSLSALPLLVLLLATAPARAQVGTFTNATATALPVESTTGNYLSAQWGDYNADGHLDILIGGMGNFGGYPPRGIWRNNSDGTFSEFATNAAPGPAGSRPSSGCPG